MIFNPFTPNKPVHSGMFSGRFREIQRTDELLYQTVNCNPTHIIYQGERGIGKTSLLLAAKFLAEGKINFSENKYNFITVPIIISEDMNIYNFAIVLKNALERVLRKSDKAYSFFKKTWDFVQRLEAAGIRVNDCKKDSDTVSIINSLIYSFVDTVKSLTTDSLIADLGLTEKKDGIVILMDEVDRSSKELNIGSFIKNLTEILAFEDCNKVLFILSGLPHLRDALTNSHESSLRLFEEFELSSLNLDEVKHVVDMGINEINNKLTHNKIKLDDYTYRQIFNYSEGYPHFVQQICYSVIEKIEERGHIITCDDVKFSMFRENGALDQIGNRYYNDLYYKKINVDSYRQILRIMSHEWNNWVTKSDIKKQFKGTEKNLDNGLHALKSKNIILHEKGSRGRYRLQWASFAFWIKNHNEMK